jgi:hypothetical protein
MATLQSPREEADRTLRRFLREIRGDVAELNRHEVSF